MSRFHNRMPRRRSPKRAARGKPPTCPICGNSVSSPADAAANRTQDAEHYPFCSLRCRQIDLLRWCEGKYAIVEPLSPEELDNALNDGDHVPDD